MSFAGSNNDHDMSHEQYRQHSMHNTPGKQLGQNSAFGEDVAASPSHNLFLNLSNSNANPLFAQDRMLVSPYNQAAYYPPIPSMDFTSVERTTERNCLPGLEHDSFQHANNGVKMEAEVHDAMSNADKRVNKDSAFHPHTLWSAQGSETDLELQDRIHPGSFDL